MHRWLPPTLLLLGIPGCSEPNPLYYAQDEPGSSPSTSFNPEDSVGSKADETVGSSGEVEGADATGATTDPAGTTTSPSGGGPETDDGDDTSSTTGGTTGSTDVECDGALCHEELTYVVAGEPTSVDVGDYDGDGDIDLIVVSEDGDAAQRLENLGGGLFLAHPPIDLPGTRPMDVCFADLDGGFPLEVVTADRDGHSASILSAGEGDVLALERTVGTGTRTEACAVYDFDDDGDEDIYVALRDKDRLGVIVNAGDGTPEAQLEFETPGEPEVAAAADFNGDGRGDLAMSHRNGEGVSFHLSAPGATVLTTSFDLQVKHFGMRAADLDANGSVDLVSSRPGEGHVAIYWDILLAGENPTVSLEAVGENPGHIAIGDFNADDRLDTAAVVRDENRVALVSGLGARAFAITTVSLDASPSDVAAADLNGDDIDDLVMTLPSTGAIVLLLSDASR